jgi:hypothetical protein
MTLTAGRGTMRIFKVADGTSWVARLHDRSDSSSANRIGWEAILFEATPGSVAQRLVYRPAGWLKDASVSELAAALDEGFAVRVRWGE